MPAKVKSTYIVTTAVDSQPLHRGFFAAVRHAMEHLDAELIVVGGVYKNPSAFKRGIAPGKEAYPPELEPFLTRKRRSLGPNVTLFGDVPCQPTSLNCLAGLESLCGATSGIIGHTSRQMRTVAGGHSPRCLWTTGAITKPKYSKSRAGARGLEHHVVGALIVEVVGPKLFFVREIGASADGSFTDLDTRYTPSGVEKAPPALTLTLGDVHVGQEDYLALEAAEALAKCVRPKALVLHDVLDFDTRSHHRRDSKSMHTRHARTVEGEIRAAVAALNDFSKWADEVVVVASNHDEHLGRWLEEADPKADPINAAFYHWLSWRLRVERDRTGQWPDAFAFCATDFGTEANVRFLRRNESYRVAGVRQDMHGDVGVAGARGSLAGFARMGCKVTVGHSHTPGRKAGAVQVGVLARLIMEYAERGPSTCLHTHCVLHADGKRQLVTTQGTEFRGAR